MNPAHDGRAPAVPLLRFRRRAGRDLRAAEGLRPFAPGQNSQTGEVHRRGPDRKPRRVLRLALLRAFVSAEEREGKPVPGLEDLLLGLRNIMGDHGLSNRPNLLRLTELVKEVFDDVPDSGTGRTWTAIGVLRA